MVKKVWKLVSSVGTGEAVTEQLGACTAAPTLYKVAWLFIIGSVFGYLLETVWYYMLRGYFVNRQGVIYGPFSPIYGIALAGFVLLLYNYRERSPLHIFLTAAVMGSLFEYTCGYLQEHILGTKSWDYSGKPFNIHGRISLEFAVYWGIIGLFAIKLAYPFLSGVIESIPAELGRKVAIVLCSVLLIDCMISGAAAIRQRERRHGKEASNAVERFMDEHYSDERLAMVFTEVRIVDMDHCQMEGPAKGKCIYEK